MKYYENIRVCICNNILYIGNKHEKVYYEIVYRRKSSSNFATYTESYMNCKLDLDYCNSFTLYSVEYENDLST